nr:hypothetical protein [uncultured Azospirillum sp.]
MAIETALTLLVDSTGLKLSGPGEWLVEKHGSKNDRTAVYAAVAARHPEEEAIAPPRADAVFSTTVETAPTRHDRHIQAIAETGRMAWQRTSGYNARAKAEVAYRARHRQHPAQPYVRLCTPDLCPRRVKRRGTWAHAVPARLNAPRWTPEILARVPKGSFHSTQ